MKLFKSWLLPATCTIILVLINYATSTAAAKQKQAEVDLHKQQQQLQFDANSDDVVALKPLKYGDKTTKKIPNGEMLLLSTTTPPIISKNYANGVVTSRGRSRFREEYIDLPTNRPAVQMPRHQLIVQQQHDIPIVQKNRELFNRSTTSMVGQRIQQNTNRSRFQNNIATPTQEHQDQQEQQQQQQLQQPTQYPNLNFESEKTIVNSKTNTMTSPTTVLATQTKYRQHRLNETTTSSRTIASAESTLSNNNKHPPLLSRNTNNSSSSFQVTHHQTRSNNNKKHQIAVETSATTTNARGNKKANQSIIDAPNAYVRNTTRRFSSSTSLKPTATSSLSSLSSASVITTIPPRSRLLMTTRKTTTTTTTSTPRPLTFQFPNNFNFNIFTPEFWQFLNPTTTPAPLLRTTKTQLTTKRPPKKYRKPTQISTKEEKLNLVKPKQNIPSRTTTTTTTIKPESVQNNHVIPPKRDDGPFRIALPTFNILTSRRETFDDREKGKRNVDNEINLRERFDCPRESEVRFQLFPKICKIDEDCKVWNREEICCEIFGAKSCVTGIPKPLEETSHAPILGVIPRKCPNRPLAELWWEVKECDNDMDCWPRVCCPDGRRRYCRTSQPELSTVPVPVKRSFNYLSEYLECTPPPPPIFDLHPKTCTSTLDCFPNVCCQEAGLRHCRPPKKSVLTMLANVFNVDFVKRLTQNIVIK